MGPRQAGKLHFSCDVGSASVLPSSAAQLASHKNRSGASVPGITYLYYEGPTLWPFGWGLSYTAFSFAWFDEEDATKTIDAAAWAAGIAASPAYAVNVTNTGNVTSDVSAMAFFSTGLPSEPIQVRG